MLVELLSDLLTGQLHHICLLGLGGKLAADENFIWAFLLPVARRRMWDRDRRQVVVHRREGMASSERPAVHQPARAQLLIFLVNCLVL